MPTSIELSVPDFCQVLEASLPPTLEDILANRLQFLDRKASAEQMSGITCRQDACFGSRRGFYPAQPRAHRYREEAHPRKKYRHPEQQGWGVLSAGEIPSKDLKRTMHVSTSCC